MSDNISRALSDPEVRNAKAKAKPYKLTDGGGLFLLVQPNGAKLWRYKFRMNGKEGLHAIGAYPDVSLSAARAEHRAARAIVAAGQNPVKVRQEERRKATQEDLLAKAGTFDAVLKGWKETNSPRLAPLSIKQRDRECAKHLEAEFTGRQVNSIKRVEISTLIKRIEARTPEVAKNLRNYLNGIFEHAIGMGLMDANPVPPPMILKRRSAVSHAAMSLGAVPDFMAKVRSCGANPQTKTAILLVVLTACRKTEVCGARWSEFDLDAGEWIIPASRMKAGREHWVPLSSQAVALLRELRPLSKGEFLFPHRDKSGDAMASRTLNMLLDRLGFKGETVHGFRSVFSTHFNAQPGVNPDVVERCLAHAPKDKVRAAYNRHQYRDERREILQAWADLIEKIQRPPLRLVG